MQTGFIVPIQRRTCLVRGTGDVVAFPFFFIVRVFDFDTQICDGVLVDDLSELWTRGECA